MYMLCWFCIGAALAATDAGCDLEDNAGVYLVQTDRRAKKATAREERPALKQVTHLKDHLSSPWIAPDVAVLERKLQAVAPWLFWSPLPSQQLNAQGLGFPSLSSLPGGLQSLSGASGPDGLHVNLKHGGLSPSGSLKLVLSTPFILCGIYMLIMRLKSTKASRAPSENHAFNPVPLYMTCLICSAGGTMIITLKPYIAIDFGATPGMVGLLQSSFSITQFFGTLVMGYLADIFGRKQLILTLPIGHILAHLGCAVSTSYTPFLLSRLLLGCFGGIVPICEVLVAENTEPSERAGALGKLMAVLGLGVVIGPGLASLLAPIGTANIFYAAAGMALVIWMWLLWAFDDSWKGAFPVKAEPAEGSSEGPAEQHLEGKPQDSLPKMLLFWYLCVIIGGSSSASSMSMMPLFYLETYGVDQRQMGEIFMLSGFVMIFAQAGLAGPASKKFGELGASMLGLAIAGLGLAMLLFITNPIVPWLVAIIGTSAGAFTDPASCAAVSTLATDRNRGTLLGIYQALRAAASGIGPIVGGMIYEVDIFLPFRISIWTCASIFVITGVLLCAKRSAKDDSHEQSFEVEGESAKDGRLLQDTQKAEKCESSHTEAKA
eukprot:TRINITY_DN21955_c0_g1_i1.p1 TRINITY_DN21955_c0_g1~~TRINITY_DN21955_c0_g1_i1.p1  ORF type:complete len:604 (+),score=89.35 TRINITY_DN21955_c0_g1_i1:96-1907(+)